MTKRLIYTTLIVATIIFGFISYGFSAAQVGVIMCSDIPYYRAIHKAFTEELESKGIKAEIFLQTPSPDMMAWANAARKFVAVETDFIITYGVPVTQAAISETSKIPVIFAGVYDSADLDMRGKRTTGIISKVSVAGLLKNLRSINNFSTLGIIYNGFEKDTLREVAEAERLGTQLTFKTVKFNINRKEDISNIKGVDALLITTSCTAMMYIDDIIHIARKQGILTAAMIGGGETKGVILTLTADPEEQGKSSAAMLEKITRGESTSNIPVENPKKIQFIVNFKEANDLGFKVPFDIMSAATKVIQ
ncbi:MAG: ABC transporter substrate binding protein [Nitrospirota bacterium]